MQGDPEMSQPSALPVETTVDEDADVIAALLPVPSQIEHFLAGTTTGRALFEALYDDVLDVPVPPRLTDLLRR
jgi:hypothetical protein